MNSWAGKRGNDSGIQAPAERAGDRNVRTKPDRNSLREYLLYTSIQS